MGLKERIKKMFSRKIDVWVLQNCKMFGDWMCGEMDSKDFDKKVKEGKYVVPIIDGYAYTYLSTPAYPIIIKRCDKVDLKYRGENE